MALCGSVGPGLCPSCSPGPRSGLRVRRPRLPGSGGPWGVEGGSRPSGGRASLCLAMGWFPRWLSGQVSRVRKGRSESLRPSRLRCGGAAAPAAGALAPGGLGLLGSPAFRCRPLATPYAEPSVLPFCVGKRGTTVSVLPGGAQNAPGLGLCRSRWGAVAVGVPPYSAWGRSQSRGSALACGMNE